MNKSITFLLVFIFIISTAITKNSAKKVEEKIYKKKENLVILENEYELMLKNVSEKIPGVNIEGFFVES